MDRGIEKLSALAVQKAKGPAFISDGGGLFLRVKKSGSKSWVFRWERRGKMRHMGLGPLHTIGLSDARELARRCRKEIYDGSDPIELRKDRRRQAALERSRLVTFGECAKAYIDAHRSSWSSEKHIWQWETTLEKIAGPVIGHIPAKDIDTQLVMQVLSPVWHKTTETADRLRNRIALVLDWAAAMGYRAGANPAAWVGNLEHLLADPDDIKETSHYKSLPYEEIGTFMAKLRKIEGIGPRALEMTILTALRSGELRGARWEEFNLGERAWLVPAARMKMRKEHRVPLCDRAIEIFQEMEAAKVGPFVFPGMKAGKPISNMTMTQIVRRMDYDVNVHGFRATLRTWAGERTNFAREVCEAALAHSIGNKVEQSYNRGDLFMKRMALMRQWAEFCNTPSASPGAVLPMLAADKQSFQAKSNR